MEGSLWERSQNISQGEPFSLFPEQGLMNSDVVLSTCGRTGVGDVWAELDLQGRSIVCFEGVETLTCLLQPKYMDSVP